MLFHFGGAVFTTIVKDYPPNKQKPQATNKRSPGDQSTKNKLCLLLKTSPLLH